MTLKFRSYKMASSRGGGGNILLLNLCQLISVLIQICLDQSLI